MGILTKLRLKAEQKTQEINNKAKKKADGFIDTYLNSEGKERAKAKSCLMQMTLAYPVLTVDYLGGSPSSPDQKEDIEVQVIPQGLVFSDYSLDFIPFEDITGVQFKTQTEIEKDVTLPRILALGIYSLAFQKKRTKTYKYLVISCKGIYPYKIILAGYKTSYIYQEIHSKRLG